MSREMYPTTQTPEITQPVVVPEACSQFLVDLCTNYAGQVDQARLAELNVIAQHE